MYEELMSSVTSSGSRSQNFDKLTADEKKDVVEFIDFLETTDMSRNTVNSYKSYVTKAILKTNGIIEGDLTNDEKSATRKFLGWIGTQERDEDTEVDIEDELEDA